MGFEVLAPGRDASTEFEAGSDSSAAEAGTDGSVGDALRGWDAVSESAAEASAGDAEQDGASGCRADADCDDGVGCTEDRCIGGSCEHRPIDARCSGELRFCDPGLGCVACRTDAHCDDDGSDCTAETCVEGACRSTALATGTPCSGGWCDGDGACVECLEDAHCASPEAPWCDPSMHRCVACRTDADCDDGNDCSEDRCVSGSCTVRPLPWSGCAISGDPGTGLCDGAGRCVGSLRPPEAWVPSTGSDGDEVGASVALAVLDPSVRFVLVGAPGAGTRGEGMVWELLWRDGEPVPSDVSSLPVPGGPGDRTGEAVAWGPVTTDLRQALVGQPRYTGGWLGPSGRALVLERPATEAGWRLLATLEPPSSTTGSSWGAALAWQPSASRWRAPGVLLVGGPDRNLRAGVGASGAVLLYFDDGFSSPALQWQPPGGFGTLEFGASVALSLPWAWVGMPDGEPEAVLGYEAMPGVPLPSWSAEPTTRLRAPDGGRADQFGQAVAATSSYVAVGAPSHDHAGGLPCGAVYVFRRDAPSGSFGLIGELRPAACERETQFGAALAWLDGQWLVVGAPGEHTIAEPAGAVYVYSIGEPLPAEPALKLVPPPSASGEVRAYGASVSGVRVVLAGGGTRAWLVVGAPGDGRVQGRVYFHDLSLPP